MSEYIRLTQVQEKLLDTLMGRPFTWVTTSEIADMLGMELKNFGRHYRQQLQYLADNDLIEQEVTPRGIVLKSYRYRFVDKG